jgi:hypothetical protein
MSEKSIQYREPAAEERQLLSALLKQVPHLLLPQGWLDSVRVWSLDDGRMGSFRIAPHSTKVQRPGRADVASLEFCDIDGIKVLVSLNLDSEGEPFEVDIWKTNFQPLIRLPYEWT